ncbi:toxin-antitoxin system, toxin component [Streptomyces macrosporus]|uniref:toxin-antitoxin system, toxin component n=1 Tax=Streptomyces macrosporus TaxID=44032 RepID=UPI0031DF2A43
MSTTWGTRRAARKLAGAVTDRLSGPVSSRRLCEELCRAMGRQRGGRPIELRFIDFPPGTVTGLALIREDSDMVLVHSGTTGVQQVVAVGHELRHLTQDGHDYCVDGADVAARLLGENGDMESVLDEVLHAAARNHAPNDLEDDAERFGLTVGGLLLPWVADGAQDFGPGPRDGLVGRIQTSLGPR